MDLSPGMHPNWKGCYAMIKIKYLQLAINKKCHLKVTSSKFVLCHFLYYTEDKRIKNCGYGKICAKQSLDDIT